MRSATTAGVTVERFWQLTPTEICIEIEAWDKRQEIQDYRVGLLCASILEPHRNVELHPKPFTPQEFMPKKLSNAQKEQTPEEQLEIIKMLNAALGGELVIN